LECDNHVVTNITIMLIIFGIILTILFFSLSAFFSGSETALTSLSKYKIKKIVTLRKSLQNIFSKWLQYPQDLLTTILVGNTVVNILTSALATVIAVKTFTFLGREVVEFLTWIVITTMILIFGEIMPKIYSRSNPERTVLSVIRPLVSINRVISPFIKPIIWFVDKFTNTSVVIPASKMSFLSIEEIKNVIFESSAGGQIEKETTKMLEGALKLSRIEVSQIMQSSEKVACVNIEDNPEKIIDKLIETGRSRIPVYSEDRNKIIGIVLLKDLISSSKIEKLEFDSEIIRPVYSVPLNKKVDELLHEFQKGTTHCAVVVDSDGNMKGFVTLEDIIEEIVGEIVDEYELAKQKLLK